MTRNCAVVLRCLILMAGFAGVFSTRALAGGQLPQVPTGLTAVALPSAVKLDWSQSAGDNSYNIYRGTTSGGETLLISGETGRSYTDSTGLTNCVTYYYYVTGVNQNGESAPSNEAFTAPLAAAPPGTPPGIAAGGGINKNTLTWTVVSGATTYTVYRGTSAGSESLLTSGVSGTSFDDTTVTNGVKYYYKMTADNCTGSSSFSNEVNATSMPPAPSAPANLTATSNVGSVDLSWDTVEDATSYKVFRGTSSGAETQLVTGVTSTSYTDSAGAACTQYYYKITAVNGNSADSAYSNEVFGMPTQSAPSAPSDLNSAAGDGSVTLSWTNPTTSFSTISVYRGTTPGTGTLLTSGLNSTTYIDSTASNGTQYYYTLTASNTCSAESAFSNETSATPTHPRPYTPGSLTATPGTNNIVLSWDPATGAATYNVYRGLLGGGSTTLLTSGVTGTTYDDTAVVYCVGYVYTVTAVDSQLAESDPSDAIAAVVGAPTPSTPTGLQAAAGDGTITFSWNAVAGNVTYNIFRGTTWGQEMLVATGFSATSYVDNGLTNGTTYYYTVTARPECGSDSFTPNDVSATPAPPAPNSPSELTAIPNDHKVVLTWIGSMGATSYNIYRSTTSGSETLLVSGITDTAYGDGDAENGTEYFYEVTAVNGNSPESGFSNEASATPVAPAPEAPTNLAATPGNSSVTLTWTGSTDATSYNIYRGFGSGSELLLTTGVTDTTYTDSGALNSFTFYYEVKAVNQNSPESPFSNEVSATPSLPAPANLTATPGDGSVTLNWDASEGALGYNIYRSNVSGMETLVAAVFVGTTYTDLALINGITYYYVVRASAGIAVSADSNEVSAVPVATAPSAPTLTATAGDNSVSLAWTAPSSATSYNVYRGETSGGETLLASNVTSPAYSDTAAVNGTTYYYTVTAINQNSPESVPSNEASVTPAPPAPAAPANLVAAAGSGYVILSWTAVESATEYKIFRGLTSGGEAELLTGVTGTTYVDNSASNCVLYYYTMTAVNGNSADSEFSNEVSATPIPLAPSAPSALSATAGDSSVTLNWTASAGATGYVVYRGISSGTETFIITLLPGVTYTDTTVENGTTYFYKLSANTDCSDPSALSNEASATPAPPAPEAPTNLYWIGGNNSVTLNWAASLGATAYNIYRGTVSGSETLLTSGVTDTTYTDSTVENCTNYYYFIKAVKQNSPESASSNEVNAYPRPSTPAAPTSLNAVAGDGKVTLTWTASAGATAYTVWRGTAADNEEVFAIGVTDTSYTDGAAANGTTYYYEVTATTDCSFQSATSNEVSAGPTPAAPSAPTNLVALPGDTVVFLSWTASPTATSYNIYRGTTSGSETLLTSGVTLTTYLDLSLTDCTTYYYKIAAVNGNSAESAFSNESIATPAGHPPTDPSNLSATAGDGSVNLSWTASSNAQAYVIYRGTISGAEFWLANGVTGTTYTDSTVVNSVTYYYKVTGVKDCSAYSGFTNEASATPIPAAPEAPSNLTATAGDNSVNLGWTASQNATAYNVYRGTTSGDETLLTSGVTNNAYTDSTAVSCILYYYVVAAVDRNSPESNFSNEASALPTFATPAAPTNLTTFVNIGNDVLNWSAVSEAKSYNVYKATSSGAETLLATTTNAYYADGSVADGVTYFYQVTAVNACGEEGARSQEVSMTAELTYPAPTGLSATAGDSVVHLNWDVDADADIYQVYRGTSPGTESLYDYADFNSYDDASVTNGTTYFYRVSAITLNGEESKLSLEVSATPTPLAPAAPTNLTAQPGDGAVMLIWTASANATSYNVYRGTSSGGETLLASGVTATTYPDGTTANGTQYFYKVTAVDQNSPESDFSNEASAMPVASTPYPPSDLVATAGDGLVSLSWSAGVLATSYIIYRGTTSGGETLLASGVTDTTYADSTASNGTTYYYTVTAVNLNSPESTPTNEASATPNPAIPPAPEAPGNLTRTNGDSSVTLSWDPSTNATGYNVYRGTTSGGETLLVSGVTATTYTDTTAENGILYYYVVKAVTDNSPESSPSNEVSAYPRPATPTGVTAVAGDGLVTLTWNDVQSASSYKVWRGTSSDGENVLVSGVTATTYTDTTAVNGTLYYYFITATGANSSDSATSNEVTATPTATIPPAPEAPGNLAATAGDASVSLSWDASTNATAYSVYRGTTSGGETLLASGVTSTTYVDNTAANCTPYYYKVTAVNGNSAESSTSNEASAAPVVSPPEAPSNLTAIGNDGKVVLHWTASADATSYALYRSTVSGGETLQREGITGAAWADLATNGVTYYYKVAAVKDCSANSAFTNEASATPVAPTPDAVANLTATAGDNSVGLSWDASAFATAYNIYRGTASGDETLLASGVTDTTYADSTAVNGTTYYYIVKAVYQNSPESDASNEASATPSPNIPPAPGAPTGLTAAAGDGSVTLSWTAPAGATSYNIYRGTTSGGEFLFVSDVDGTTFTDNTTTNCVTYYYQITAVNGDSPESEFSIEVSVTPIPPAPAAPTGLTAVAGDSVVALSWTASAGATAYNVYRGTSSGSESVLATGVTATSYIDSAAANGTTYYYQVTAVTDCSAESGLSTEASGTPSAPATVAPANLSASVVSYHQVDLTWTIIGETQTGFKVLRKFGQFGAFVQIAALPADTASYNDTSVSGSNTYTYQVIATGAGGDSAPSNQQTVTTPPNPPADPTILIATVISATEVGLKWTSNSNNQTGFKVLREDANNPGFTLLATVPATQFSYRDLTASGGTDYNYQVIATNTGGDSAPATASASTPTPPPSGATSPSDLTPTVVSWHEIDLTWTDNSGGSNSFKVLRKWGIGGYSLAGTVPAGTASYHDTVLSGATTYQYEVVAISGSQTSAPSNEVSSTTLVKPPADPTNLVATLIAAHLVELKWRSNSNDQTGFHVYRGAAPDIQIGSVKEDAVPNAAGASPWVLIGTTAATQLSFMDTTVSPATSYNYEVLAFNAGGESGPSNILPVTTPSDLPAKPTAPISLTTQAVAWNEIDLSWTNTSLTQTAVKVLRRFGIGRYSVAATLPANAESFEDTVLSGETTYFYEVVAVNAGGDSAPSNEAVGTTPMKPPAPCSSLLARAASATTIQLKWSGPASNQTGYKIQRSVDGGGFEDVAAVSTVSLSYMDTGLAPGTTYTYQVLSTNAGGDSEPSNEADATTFAN